LSISFQSLQRTGLKSQGQHLLISFMNIDSYLNHVLRKQSGPFWHSCSMINHL